MSRRVITRNGLVVSTTNENGQGWPLHGKYVTGAVGGSKLGTKAVSSKATIPAVRGLRARDANTVQPVQGKVPKPNVSLNSEYCLKTGRRINKIPVAASKLVINRQHEIKEKEEDRGYSSRRLPPSVEDIDAHDGNNCFLTPEYVKDIYCYLRKLEANQVVPPDFLSHQKQMKDMRTKLVDWLVSVHGQFKLLPETLYLGISVMDRYFAKEVVLKKNVQLVGVTSLFIAAKFEEIYPPTIDDLLYAYDRLYKRPDIIDMEMDIVKRLRFNLGRPLPLHFLRRNSKAAHSSPKIHGLAKYLMELSLLEYKCASWSPSLQAAVALFVSLKILSDGLNPCWTPTLDHYSNYKEEQLEPFARTLCCVVENLTFKYQNVYKKYFDKGSKLLRISKDQVVRLEVPVHEHEYIKFMAMEPMES